MASSASDSDPNPEYWEEYSNLQRVKHQLIKEYLGGWFPKLGLWAGRILYFDTHAGRGKHKTGEYGSPLIALRTLLGHQLRDRILARSEVRFLFIERDGDNLRLLQKEINELGDLPPRIVVRPRVGEAFSILAGLVSSLAKAGSELAPAFVFVDPYGFRVPGGILKQLMSFRGVELFINIIWRELDMAMQLAKSDPSHGLGRTLDQIFDSDAWRLLVTAAEADERAEQTTGFLRQMVGARWATSIRMLGPNGATRYILLHLTNSDDGRDLIKECVWKICPDGGFYARKLDQPAQGELFVSQEPDLEPLKEWMLTILERGPQRWSDLSAALRGTLWRETHLGGIVREWRRSGRLQATEYGARFSLKANPRLALLKGNQE